MKSSLKTEIIYEFKSARRSVLFGLLSVLSVAGLVAYQFTPLSGEGIKSAGELLQFSVDKLSRALSASIAYKTAYYYNLIQLLFVVAFITNDTRDDRYFSPGVNTLGIYRFGQRPVFCERGYKLLTPESLWYPVNVAPYGRGGARDVNFSRYALRVKHDPRLTAIAQGGVRETGKGETVFAFTHDMPGLSLCIGNYKQRSIVVDSIRFALYYSKTHSVFD